ncbi:hypothetical protein [Brevibacillus choshinensis]|nr:hypothetical protein [Brevibacillus choshinensis]
MDRDEVACLGAITRQYDEFFYGEQRDKIGNADDSYNNRAR